MSAQLEGSPSCLWAGLGSWEALHPQPRRQSVSGPWGASRAGAGSRGAAGSKVSLLGSSHAGLRPANGRAAGGCLCGWQGKVSG